MMDEDRIAPQEYLRGVSEGYERPNDLNLNEFENQRTISVEGTEWTGNKALHTHKHKDKRKLSESRGIILPDIKIVNNNNPVASRSTTSTSNGVTSSTTTGQTQSSSDQSAGSPVGQVIRSNTLSSNQQSPGSNINSLPRTARLMEIVLDICIYLPDNRGIQFAVKGGRVATSSYLLELVSSHLGLPTQLAAQGFALHMVSPMLELQLKPHHIPFKVRRSWPTLLSKFTSCHQQQLELDEPLLMMRRNVLLDKQLEQQLLYDNGKAVELLYLDAKDRILSGHWPCSINDCLILAAIDMTLTWGPYNRTQHSNKYLRDNLEEFVPDHQLSKVRSKSLFGMSLIGCNGQEQLILSHYKSFSNLSPLKLRINYLQTARNMPYYGSALFSGQMERAPSSHWLKSDDLKVQIAISRQNLNIIDIKTHALMLTVPIGDCYWISCENLEDRKGVELSSLFLHFACESELSGHESSLIQIYSKQSIMMEALLSSFLNLIPDEDEQRDEENTSNGDNCNEITESLTLSLPCASIALHRVCVAKLDSSGCCLAVNGSLKNALIDPNHTNTQTTIASNV